MTNHQLTDTMIKKLPAPSRGAKIFFDAETPGLGVRIMASGHRSFIFDYRIFGRQRRMTIGDFPTWSIHAAREHARSLRVDVDKGFDPLDERQRFTQAATMQELWPEYKAKHLPTLSERSQADQRSMFEKRIVPHFGKMKLYEIRYADIQAFHSKLTRESGAVRANRILEVVRKALNLALRLEWIERNYAEGFQRNPELPREEFLTKSQIDGLMQALTRNQGNPSAHILMLLLLTGARKSEVMFATWNQFDLDAGVWTKAAATVKQRREHRVPLSSNALALLRLLKEEATTPYLFPSRASQRHMVDIKRFWQSIKKEAGLGEKVRIHDLRHTFASVLASEGESLSIIGRLLGHTQAQTTLRYAKLYDESLRAAANKVGKVAIGEEKNGK
jgi:integrase